MTLELTTIDYTGVSVSAMQYLILFQGEPNLVQHLDFSTSQNKQKYSTQTSEKLQNLCMRRCNPYGILR